MNTHEFRLSSSTLTIGFEVFRNGLDVRKRTERQRGLFQTFISPFRDLLPTGLEF